MALDIRVQQRPVTHFIGKAITARRSEFGHPGGVNSMSSGIREWLTQQNLIALSGSMHVYRRTGRDTDPIDLTVAVPVELPVKPVELPVESKGYVLGSLPAGDYLVGCHVGSHDGIAESHQGVLDWAAANKLRLHLQQDGDGHLWTARADHFLSDPEKETDESTWVTDLLFLLLQDDD
ncbi:MAG: GyrI-like domain-containing protein [Acidimicrobiaceae bacterium]|nr:GyrI-like domain-containing protein [Acidimicrobiaceae bacterium]